MSRISELNHHGLTSLLVVTSVHNSVTGVYIKLLTECKTLDNNAFADESIVQHVGYAYRIGMEENVFSGFSDLLGQFFFSQGIK